MPRPTSSPATTASRSWSGAIAALAPAAKGDLDGAEGRAGRGHRADRGRGDHPGDRGDRREHQPAPHRLSRGGAGCGRRLPAQSAVARSRQAGRARGAGIGGRCRPASPRPASSWRCTSRRPTRRRSASSKLDPAVVERERAIFAEQARASGKPENIIEKMVEGRVRKFYEEAVLLEQVFVVDTDKRVKEAVQAAAKEAGAAHRGGGFRPHGPGRGGREGRRRRLRGRGGAAGRRLSAAAAATLRPLNQHGARR